MRQVLGSSTKRGAALPRRRQLAALGLALGLLALPASVGHAQHLATAATAPTAATSPAATPPTATAPGPVGSPARRPRKVIVEPPAPVPDRAALDQAGESNLETNAPRHGLVVGLSAVAWQQVGTIDSTTGAGGFILRLGAVATPRTVLMLELFGMGFLAGSGDSYILSSQALSVMAQTYVAPTLWLRGGGGFASFTHAIEDKTNPDTFYNAYVRNGLGLTFGAGLDLVKWRRTRLALENTVALHRFAQGWIVDMGVGIGVTMY